MTQAVVADAGEGLVTTVSWAVENGDNIGGNAPATLKQRRIGA